MTFGTSQCVFTLTGSFLPRQEKGEISRDNSISFDWDNVVLWHLKSCVRRGTSPVASTSSRSLWRVTQPHSPADVGGEDRITSPLLNQLPCPEPSALSALIIRGPAPCCLTCSPATPSGPGQSCQRSKRTVRDLEGDTHGPGGAPREATPGYGRCQMPHSWAYILLTHGQTWPFPGHRNPAAPPHTPQLQASALCRPAIPKQQMHRHRPRAIASKV